MTNGTRVARGSVSGDVGNGNVYWTESPDILNLLGLNLNPHQ